MDEERERETEGWLRGSAITDITRGRVKHCCRKEIEFVGWLWSTITEKKQKEK